MAFRFENTKDTTQHERKGIVMIMKIFLASFVALISSVVILAGGCQQGPPEHERQRAFLAQAEAEMSEDQFEELIHDRGNHPARDLRQEMADGSVFTMDRYSFAMMKESERFLRQKKGVMTAADRLALYREADTDGNFHISRKEARKVRDHYRKEVGETLLVHRSFKGVVFSMDIETASLMEQAESIIHQKITEPFRAEQAALRASGLSLAEAGLRERDRRSLLKKRSLDLFRKADAEGDGRIGKEGAKEVYRKARDWFPIDPYTELFSEG